VLLSILLSILYPKSEVKHQFLSEEKKQRILQNLKFAMIFSAFIPQSYSELINDAQLNGNLSTLLVGGIKDEIVPISFTQELAAAFQAKSIEIPDEQAPSGGKVVAIKDLCEPKCAMYFEHPGSHYIPLTSKTKSLYLSFFSSFQ
jgi:hypothetical protein